MVKMKLLLILSIILCIFCAQAEARTEKMIVTGYCICEKCCPGFADGKTSIGDDATIFDGVAVAPKAIPYRTKIRIPGIGVKEADDTGGAMRKAWRKGIYHIDIRFSSHQEALNWGRQFLEVEIEE